MTKLEKIDKELSKAREKAAEWQTKIRVWRNSVRKKKTA